MDPHVDPANDGPHVFLLALLSGSVFTFVPPGRPLVRSDVEVFPPAATGFWSLTQTYFLRLDGVSVWSSFLSWRHP